MGHLLKLKREHSPLNLRILSSTCVPFTLTTLQVLNLALTHKKRITVHAETVILPISLKPAVRAEVQLKPTGCRPPPPFL
jgi:hypothetical protein